MNFLKSSLLSSGPRVDVSAWLPPLPLPGDSDQPGCSLPAMPPRGLGPAGGLRGAGRAAPPTAMALGTVDALGCFTSESDADADGDGDDSAAVLLGEARGEAAGEAAPREDRRAGKQPHGEVEVEEEYLEWKRRRTEVFRALADESRSARAKQRGDTRADRERRRARSEAIGVIGGVEWRIAYGAVPPT